VKGSYMGSAVPTRDLPRYIALYKAGRLPVDRLLTHRLRLEEVNEAFDRLASGRYRVSATAADRCANVLLTTSRVVAVSGSGTVDPYQRPLAAPTCVNSPIPDSATSRRSAMAKRTRLARSPVTASPQELRCTDSSTGHFFFDSRESYQLG